jgi:anti-sigma B factor antagonist
VTAVVGTIDPGLEIRELGLGETAGVSLRGEVELATAPALTAALDDAVRASSGLFVIDLGAVDFLDSSGIACLVRARAMLGQDDRQLVLICPPGSARRALLLTGIDDLVPLYASREELARALA